MGNWLTDVQQLGYSPAFTLSQGGVNALQMEHPVKQ